MRDIIENMGIVKVICNACGTKQTHMFNKTYACLKCGKKIFTAISLYKAITEVRTIPNGRIGSNQLNQQ